MTEIIVKIDDRRTSHSGIVKQVIDQLVNAKWAPRKEIEEEFVYAIQSGVYRKTVS